MRLFAKCMTALAVFAVSTACGLQAAEVKTGEKAPDFTLTAADGDTHSLSDFEGKYVVLEWINHGCPFVKKHYNSDNMQSLQKKYTDKGVVWLSICSSAEGKQGYHTPEEWQDVNEEKESAATALLLDEDGDVGRAYGAKTTPHMYVIDPEGTLIYQGAIDSIPSADPDDADKADNYVAMALDAAMNDQPVEPDTTRPYGCSVKY